MLQELKAADQIVPTIKKKAVNTCGQFISLFVTVLGPRQYMMPPTRVGLPNHDNPPHTCSEACLMGNSKAHQIDT